MPEQQLAGHTAASPRCYLSAPRTDHELLQLHETMAGMAARREEEPAAGRDHAIALQPQWGRMEEG